MGLPPGCAARNLVGRNFRACEAFWYNIPRCLCARLHERGLLLLHRLRTSRTPAMSDQLDKLCAACMAASLALCDADIPLRGLCGGGCVELGEGAVAVVALEEGVVASRVDGAGDTAAALDEALDAAAAARGRMRAALVERVSSG